MGIIEMEVLEVQTQDATNEKILLTIKDIQEVFQCADTPTAKARWVLIYIHFQIYSKAYKTNKFL